MPAIALALTASAAYGASDLVAALAARRVRPIAVAWWGHALGTAALLALTLALGVGGSIAAIALGALGGLVAAGGLVVFYAALARGPVSVMTPLAASGVVVPVAVGIAGGESPGVLAWAGLLVAAIGVLTIATTRGDDDEPTPPCPAGRPTCPEEQGRHGPALPPVAASLLAAATFGLAFVLVDAGGGQPGHALWVAVGAQAGGLLGLVPIVLATIPGRLAVSRDAAALVAGAGLLAATGDVSLVLAFNEGQLGVVSVLASLDSVFSLLLARVVLTERLPRRQALGVAAAVLGAVVLASA